ncbi:MAG TPA: ABC transporter substrate-binding protein [Opitutaceae bacterium]|nr:ABC transporter substrate-binding protein [Opitutaceae bacterium]
MRLICISAEAAEICWSLGVWDQVIGVTAFAPKHFPTKPVVSGFASGSVERILALSPDLVISFSDVQAKLVDQLIGGGLNVFALSYFHLTGVAQAISLLGRLLGVPEKGENLAHEFNRALAAGRFSPPVRPRIYFEEWDSPLIHAVPWVQEIIELAGGDYVFKKPAANRVVTEGTIFSMNPEIILASWCGKSVDLAAICARPGFAEVEAVKRRHVYSIDPEKILQAGPQLLEGLKEIRMIIQDWCTQTENLQESP